MKFSRALYLTIAFAVLAPGANAQDDLNPPGEDPSPQQVTPSPLNETGIDNPFRQWRAAIEQESAEGMSGSGGYGMKAMSSYGSGDYGSSSGSSGPPSPSDLFQQAVRRSVKQLKSAKTEAEKQKQLELLRSAFNERYERALVRRQQDLDKLEQRLQKLQEDLQHRREAQEKVVEVQLRTVELAGEGLVELGAKQSPGR